MVFDFFSWLLSWFFSLWSAPASIVSWGMSLFGIWKVYNWVQLPWLQAAFPYFGMLFSMLAARYVARFFKSLLPDLGVKPGSYFLLLKKSIRLSNAGWFAYSVLGIAMCFFRPNYAPGSVEIAEREQHIIGQIENHFIKPVENVKSKELKDDLKEKQQKIARKNQADADRFASLIMEFTEELTLLRNNELTDEAYNVLNAIWAPYMPKTNKKVEEKTPPGWLDNWIPNFLKREKVVPKRAQQGACRCQNRKNEQYRKKQPISTAKNRDPPLS